MGIIIVDEVLLRLGGGVVSLKTFRTLQYGLYRSLGYCLFSLRMIYFMVFIELFQHMTPYKLEAMT